MDNKVVKYFAHNPGYDIAKEMQAAYLYNTLEGARNADKAVFTPEEIAKFQYVRVTMEIIKSEEK